MCEQHGTTDHNGYDILTETLSLDFHKLQSSWNNK